MTAGSVCGGAAVVGETSDTVKQKHWTWHKTCTPRLHVLKCEITAISAGEHI